MPRIIQAEGREGVIAFVEVGWYGFVRVIDFNAVMQPMRVAVVRVDEKIGLIADPKLKSFAEQVVKKVVVFVQAPPEIAEIDADPSLHRESIGVFPAMTIVFSLVEPETRFGMGIEVLPNS
jgi:hypothetical protein